MGTLHQEEHTPPPVCTKILMSKMCYSGLEGSHLLRMPHRVGISGSMHRAILTSLAHQRASAVMRPLYV